MFVDMIIDQLTLLVQPLKSWLKKVYVFSCSLIILSFFLYNINLQFPLISFSINRDKNY